MFTVDMPPSCKMPLIYCEKSLNIFYNDKTGKIEAIHASNGKLSSYKTVGGDLVQITNAAGRTYKYEYDKHHNLTKISFADGTNKQLTYNIERDLVTTFRNRKGCLESYSYEVSPEDPKNHFWSKVKKVCDGKVTNRSRYEFIHKFRSDDGMPYLEKSIADVNGRHAEFEYNEQGLVVRSEKDDLVTTYRYDPAGRRIEVREGNRIEARLYESFCEKPSDRRISIVDPATNRIRQESLITYHYNMSCNLVEVYTSDGRRLKLSYEDAQGRADLLDEQGRSIHLEYEFDLRKPNKIVVDGIGELNLSYDNEGAVQLGNVSTGSDTAKKMLMVLQTIRDLLPSRDF